MPAAARQEGLSQSPANPPAWGRSRPCRGSLHHDNRVPAAPLPAALCRSLRAVTRPRRKQPRGPAAPVELEPGWHQPPLVRDPQSPALRPPLRSCRGKPLGPGLPHRSRSRGRSSEDAAAVPAPAADAPTLPARLQSCTAWHGGFQALQSRECAWVPRLPCVPAHTGMGPRACSKHAPARAREMSSLMGNPRGEVQCCSTPRLKLVWEAVGLRSLGTEGEGRAGRSATGGTTSSPVRETNMSHSSLPRTPCTAVGLGDLPVPAAPPHG